LVAENEILKDKCNELETRVNTLSRTERRSEKIDEEMRCKMQLNFEQRI